MTCFTVQEQELVPPSEHCVNGLGGTGLVYSSSAMI